MNTAELIAEARRRGVTLQVRDGKLRVTGPARAVEALRPVLTAQKSALLAVLSHGVADSNDLLAHDLRCACKTLAEHLDRGGSFDSWEPLPPATDHRFVAVATIDPAIAKLACCIACGWGVEMHGSPPFETWRFVDDPDTVELIEARGVVAAAAAAHVAGGNDP